MTVINATLTAQDFTDNPERPIACGLVFMATAADNPDWAIGTPSAVLRMTTTGAVGQPYVVGNRYTITIEESA